ncbi:hypothetical protein ACIRL2_44670 [Embleya sp. NPDC127516]|uniref:hypothetical protein n=1 Tax=Embleya sp. NPDC127516 TaxID=3363990 RepID=UPI00381A40F0
MKDTALHPVAADYRLEVARILADLPVAEAEEILDDVEVNLSEVLAELDEVVTSESLRARLGTPHEYAAELRAAAGYPPLTPTGTRPLSRIGKVELLCLGLFLALGAAFVTGIGIGAAEGGQERWWIFPCLLGLAVEALNALWLRGRAPGLPEIAALSITERARTLGDSLRTGRWAEPVRFLIGLQSAWWVTRALIVVVLVRVLAGGVWWPVAAGVLALAGSLWLGPRAAHDRRLLWAAVPINALVIGAGIGMLAAGQLTPESTTEYVNNAPPRSNYYSAVDGHPLDGSALLTTESGGPLKNIYPFDAQGRPLKDVLLFDHNGKQLGIVGDQYERYCGPTNQSVVPNRESLPFPQPRVVGDSATGKCRVEEGTAPFTIAIPVRPGGQPAANPMPGAAPQSGAQVPQGGGQPPQTVPSAPPSAGASGAVNPANPPVSPTSPTTPPVSPNSAPPASQAGPKTGESATAPAESGS